MKRQHDSVSGGSEGGFTLIELLVVIAIIGVLAAIILAALGTTRSKGNDAKIEEQMKSVQSAAAIYYTSNGNYGTDNAAGDTICTLTVDNSSSGLINLMTAANWPDLTAPTCNTDAGASTPATVYAIYHQLMSDTTQYFCVDSTGAAVVETTAPSGSPTSCW